MKSLMVIFAAGSVACFVFLGDNPMGRVAGAALALFAIASAMNVWSNR